MATQQEIDSAWMRHAVNLAQRGAGSVSPNPLVGCVIARGTELIAEGYHAQFGGPHAEAIALRNAHGLDIDGASLYVTLEPCSHHGKQPPCADAIIASSLKRIVVGCPDPNPLVSGKGLAALRAAGKDVVVGIEQDFSAEVARYFLHAIRCEQPYFVAKMAVSADNRVNQDPQKGRWLTSIESRTAVHRLRSEIDAVLVGVGTINADNPSLDVRHVSGRNPVRIVVDPSCRVAEQSRIVQTSQQQSTWMITDSRNAETDHAKRLANIGVEVLFVDSQHGMLPPHDVASLLYTRGLQSVLVEGGPVTLDNFLGAKLIQEMHIHRSPEVVGSGYQWEFDYDPHTWQKIREDHIGCDQHSIFRLRA